MRRIFSDYAYGPGPRDGCWWDETIAAPDWPRLSGEVTADVAIIGGGFTGMSAALHLAEAGAKVALLEAETPGWGASGRNGGFCCIGGAKLSGAAMRRKFGAEATDVYDAGEVAAVDLVHQLLDRHQIAASCGPGSTSSAVHSRLPAGCVLLGEHSSRSLNHAEHPLANDVHPAPGRHRPA